MWPLFGFHGKFTGWPILVACCGDIPEQQDIYFRYAVTHFCYTCSLVKDTINPAVCVFFFCVCVRVLKILFGGHSWLT